MGKIVISAGVVARFSARVPRAFINWYSLLRQLWPTFCALFLSEMNSQFMSQLCYEPSTKAQDVKCALTSAFGASHELLRLLPRFFALIRLFDLITVCVMTGSECVE